MKVLLDENLPHSLRHHLPGHDVYTVTYQRWSGVKNGELLQLAAAAGFDVQTLPLSVIIISASSNDVDDLLPLVPAILARLTNLPLRSIERLP